MKPKKKKHGPAEIEARAREFGKARGWTEKQIGNAVFWALLLCDVDWKKEKQAK